MTVAIVLAGSLNQGPLKDCSNELNEALIKVGPRCMVEYVVKALSEAKNIEKIIVVGPQEKLETVLGQVDDLKVIEGGKTIIQSLLNGLDLIENEKDHILIVTADIPLITGRIIDHFLECCYREDADIIYPIVDKTLNEQKYPGVKRTYVKLKEGIFTGGNIFYVNPIIIRPLARKAEQLVSLRKSPVRLANYIGILFILKYLLKKLSIEEAEKRVSELFAINGKTITIPYPEIGIDVDKPSDLTLVEEILACN